MSKPKDYECPFRTYGAINGIMRYQCSAKAWFGNNIIVDWKRDCPECPVRAKLNEYRERSESNTNYEYNNATATIPYTTRNFSASSEDLRINYEDDLDTEDED